MKHKWTYGIGVVCLFVLYATAAPAQGTAVEDAFKRGATALRDGRNADAESAFREAVSLAPQMPEAHLDLGLVLAREGKLQDATSSVEKALKLDSKLESAHMFLGIFYHQTNREVEARTQLQTELDQRPDNAEALTWLGIVELAAGRPEAAAGAFDRAAVLTPDDLNVLEYRGHAHTLVARDTYAHMARLAPDSWHVHRVRAQLLVEGGDHKEAIAEYEAAIKLEDHNADLYEELGDEYRQTSQLDSAQKVYAKGLELSPSNLVAMYNLGSTEVERGNNAAGIPLLEAMLRTYPAPVAEYYLGRALAAQSREADAVPWLEKSALADANGEIARRSYYELARVFRKLHRPQQAENALNHYNRLREQEQAKDTRQVEDWRKFSTPATSQSGAPASKPAAGAIHPQTKE